MSRELSAELAAVWQSTSWVEILAALLAIAYLVLAIRQMIACWLAAFLSSCLYVWVLLHARLYMESLLNGFYAVMAVYGFWQWTGNGGTGTHRDGGVERGGEAANSALPLRGGGDGSLPVSRWPSRRHAAAAAAVGGLSLVTWYFLRRFTPAAWPLIDSLVTWASVFATFLVARKVYENWYWWLIIDSVSLCLCFARHLYLTMLLFGLYLLMIIAGMRAWRRAAPPAHAPQSA